MLIKPKKDVCHDLLSNATAQMSKDAIADLLVKHNGGAFHSFPNNFVDLVNHARFESKVHLSSVDSFALICYGSPKVYVYPWDYFNWSSRDNYTITLWIIMCANFYNHYTINANQMQSLLKEISKIWWPSDKDLKGLWSLDTLTVAQLYSRLHAQETQAYKDNSSKSINDKFYHLFNFFCVITSTSTNKNHSTNPPNFIFFLLFFKLLLFFLLTFSRKPERKYGIICAMFVTYCLCVISIFLAFLNVTISNQFSIVWVGIHVDMLR
ncbi:hypothetical protein RFI_11654 [Reticulomyxa filosa]|uniref:Uncharacterized protein n=1 Tax=Reticulomyxa filosa TaxID=46433 RepID=X6NHL7_RETFI|nr:hypothetical protein RFI_11654 [Reticulomyxa filosa]|eukprot:ETO25481.1 hypothetical protein RFI_11654 [Reticulomyxa filosa]